MGRDTDQDEDVEDEVVHNPCCCDSLIFVYLDGLEKLKRDDGSTNHEHEHEARRNPDGDLGIT